MKPYFVTTSCLKPFFHKALIWNIPTDDKIIYLTFDDGPTPGVTDKVLDLLSAYDAKATFFCIGKNVENHPDIYQNILDQGHAAGNHTQSHNKGINTKDADYYESIEQASALIESNLFRPPYGRIRRKQVRFLKNNYKIIMWSVLCGDFDLKMSKEKCKSNVLKHTKSGSIVVFHDSLKAADKMFYALEACLSVFKEKGYRFDAIKL